MLRGTDITWTFCVSESETGNACSKNTEGATLVSCFKRGRQQTETGTTNLPISQILSPHRQHFQVGDKFRIKQNKQRALFWEWGGEHGTASVLPDDFQSHWVGILPCHVLFPSQRVPCLGLAHRWWGIPLSDYRESDFKRNPKEIENTPLFKHTFQKKNPS